MENYPERGSRPTLNVSDKREEVTQTETKTARVSERALHKASSAAKKSGVKLLVIVALALLVGVIFWWAFLRNVGIPSYIETDKYQVACLQSGECYFGKVTSVTGDTIIIKDVFYVQKTAQTATSENKSDSNLELIKLGNEVHGPEDMMALTRSQVLYVENLKADGKVSQTIKSYHEQNK